MKKAQGTVPGSPVPGCSRDMDVCTSLADIFIDSVANINIDEINEERLRSFSLEKYNIDITGHMHDFKILTRSRSLSIPTFQEFPTQNVPRKIHTFKRERSPQSQSFINKMAKRSKSNLGISTVVSIPRAGDEEFIHNEPVIENTERRTTRSKKIGNGGSKNVKSAKANSTSVRDSNAAGEMEDEATEGPINYQNEVIEGSINDQDEVTEGPINYQDEVIEGSINDQDEVTEGPINYQDEVIEGSINDQDEVIEGSINDQNEVIEDPDGSPTKTMSKILRIKSPLTIPTGVFTPRKTPARDTKEVFSREAVITSITASGSTLNTNEDVEEIGESTRKVNKDLERPAVAELVSSPKTETETAYCDFSGDASVASSENQPSVLSGIGRSLKISIPERKSCKVTEMGKSMEIIKK